MSTEVVMESEDLSCFECPGCGGALAAENAGVCCSECAHEFPSDDGILQLYWPNSWEEGRSDVTEEVKAFYEDCPFPNYDDFDSVDSLVKKAREGTFARLLDEQVPPGARVIECGCGTGQLSNFLSIHNRQVFGTDLCMNSLKLGQGFARRHGLGRVRFVQMNLFRPAFRRQSFHLVISNGVLHHTSDPRGGFESIARLVKPGGYILIGLYHHWGRLITDMRRAVFNMSGDRLKALDPNLRGLMASDAKKRAWFNDQYKHPLESKHTIRETLAWLDEAGFDFVKSIPSSHLFRTFEPNEPLFIDEAPAGNFEALITEMGMFFKGSREGGFFTMIGKKRP
jgi:SAM-dependent methyltransferase